MSDVSDAPAAPTPDDDPEVRIEALVEEWLTLPDAAQQQGVRITQVRGQLADRELVAVRRGPNAALYVPAVFVTPEGPLPDLRGTITVLADGGMSDPELVAWLFTPDPTLPVGETPMDCLLAGRKKEIRRRAMETAF